MKKWYKKYENAERDARRESKQIVSGSNGWGDIYYLVPETPNTLVYLSGLTISGHGERKCRVCWIDERGNAEVIETTEYRFCVGEDGEVTPEQMSAYLHGYYTRSEERSKKVKLRKEAARYSHEVCDWSGAVGHEERQRIRREWLRANG